MLKQKITKPLVKRIYKRNKCKQFKLDEKTINDTDCDNDYDEFKKQTKCEYLDYFDRKTKMEPAYVPEKLLFPKPSDGKI